MSKTRLSDTEDGPDDLRAEMYIDTLKKLLVLSFPRNLTDEQFDHLLTNEWMTIIRSVRGNRSRSVAMTWADVSAISTRICERCIEILANGIETDLTETEERKD